MFALGCPELIVTTDHKPLLCIFINQYLSNIPNPHICSLKKPIVTNLKQFIVQENGSEVLVQFPEIQQDPH